MQPTEANNSNKRVVFIAIGLILLGLVVFGVIWSKNRAEQVANTSETTHQTEGDTQVEQEPTVSEENMVTDEPQEVQANSEGHVAAAQDVTQASPTTEIPAAGAPNTVLVATLVSILAFTLVKFVRSEVLDRRA